MPVSTTTDKNILKITVPAPSMRPRHPDPELERSIVVCYVRLTDKGIGIYYSHHETTVRASTVGEWSDTQIMQVPLTRPVRSLVQVGVMQEFWDSLDPKIGDLVKPNNIAEILEED